MYAYYGTNKYNFEKLENPPAFEPAKCLKCQRVIRLGVDDYAMTGDGYICERCYDVRIAERTRPSRVTK